ncbi:hypothetical protein ACFUN7_10730 [Streptomyces sp. NPDC057236]|uniref:effector-associated constant component EACC1 n=1 Tax=Streptomyces sp. NPDC057236 TaxID=3346059 RepID=UPI0036364FED
MSGTASVQVRVRVGKAANYDETLDLLDWLTEARLRNSEIRAVEGSTSESRKNTQGVIDLIDLVLSSGFSAASLWVSIAAWRRASGSASEIRLESQGNSVTITDASDGEAAIRFLEEINRSDEQG